MKLHVLTAITRPTNLNAVAHTLAQAARVPDIEICWHWRYDLERAHIGGQAIKNRMLDGVTDGWVWMLDDDTVAHPGIFKLAAAAIEQLPDIQALVVSQRRTDGRVLRAHPENVMVGSIDIGQAILSRDLIGDHRLPLTYEGDGEFLSEILPGSRVVYFDHVLSFHNALDAVASFGI